MPYSTGVEHHSQGDPEKRHGGEPKHQTEHNQHPPSNCSSPQPGTFGQDGLVSHPNSTPRKRHKGTRNSWGLFATGTFGLLWLAPMLALMYLNFTETAIGGSAWCMREPCGVMSYYQGDTANTNTNSLIGKYNMANRNLLGGLQFVAKALEVWYVFIAGSLVYIVASSIARKKGGLPTGYFLAHLQFRDLRFLLDPGLYAAPRDAHGHSNAGSRSHALYLYLFMALAISICAIANLMGPSVAVLLLPELHWLETPEIPDIQFNELMSGSPPAGNLIPNCTSEELSVRNYTCFQNHHRYDIDALIINNAVQINKMVDERPEDDLFDLIPDSPVLYEGVMPFIFNVTFSPKALSFVTWSLNRQVLRQLSKDFEGLFNVVRGNTTANPMYTERYAPYNSSRSLVLQRMGPVVAVGASGFSGNLTTTAVGNDRDILCYDSMDIADQRFSKCFRSGSGWNKTNTVASFIINATNEDSQPIKVRSYWSDRSVKRSIDSSGACFVNGTAPEGDRCDYDKLFAPGHAPLFDGDQTQDVLVMEFSRPTSDNPNGVWWAQFMLSYSFTKYAFDATTIIPNLENVQIPDPPDPDTDRTFPMVFDPNWILAIWGLSPGAQLTTDSTAVRMLQKSANKVVDPRFPDAPAPSLAFYGAVQYMMLQAASIVPFSSDHANTLDPSNATEEKPVLWINVRREAWGWSIRGRTSVLGVVVTIMGIVTVLVRTVLLIVTREDEKGGSELAAAALQHEYDGAFADAVKESDLSRVRYRIREDQATGKLRFDAVW